jgi:hypothetical protein
MIKGRDAITLGGAFFAEQSASCDDEEDQKTTNTMDSELRGRSQLTEPMIVSERILYEAATKLVGGFVRRGLSLVPVRTCTQYTSWSQQSIIHHYQSKTEYGDVVSILFPRHEAILASTWA